MKISKRTQNYFCSVCTSRSYFAVFWCRLPGGGEDTVIVHRVRICVGALRSIPVRYAGQGPFRSKPFVIFNFLHELQKYRFPFFLSSESTNLIRLIYCFVSPPPPQALFTLYVKQFSRLEFTKQINVKIHCGHYGNSIG